MLRTKGVHFFDVNYGRGMGWYGSRFPTKLTAWYVARRHGTELLTGEASPYYLFHPHVPHRVAEHLPRVKLIALLRDPVGRAYSHYQHEVARGFETLSFEEAIEAEPARLAGETRAHAGRAALQQLRPPAPLVPGQGPLPRAAGSLAVAVRRRAAAGAVQRALLRRARAVVQQVLDFLELPAFTPDAYERHNAHDYRRMGDEVRPRLVEHYREPNRRLYESLGDDFGWSA